MINWAQTQQRLNAVGRPVGAADGVPGRATYTGLLWLASQRQPDALMRTIAQELATQLPGTPIIASAPRLADFLAQTCDESGGYAHLEENFHYSAARIHAVWPSRFPTVESALAFAWDPTDPDREDIALADQVYNGRMGNRPGTNDGWDNRGRGLMQHTGAEEYTELGKIGLRPDDLGTPAGAVKGAINYYLRKNVIEAVDRSDYVTARRRVNGGTIGLDTVNAARQRLLGVLS